MGFVNQPTTGQLALAMAHAGILGWMLNYAIICIVIYMILLLLPHLQDTECLLNILAGHCCYCIWLVYCRSIYYIQVH